MNTSVNIINRWNSYGRDLYKVGDLQDELKSMEQRAQTLEVGEM
jgi:hypothetical protein